MTKAEKTKDYIIEKSAPIFNKKGYAGTSLTDLMESTGLTKGAIYGNFINKNEVALAVYNYNVTSLNTKISIALCTKETARDKLIAFTDFYRKNWKTMFEKGGCPILNASIEADDNLPCLKKSVQSSITTWVDTISTIIEQGKANGEFKSSIISADYAYAIIMLIEGGIMLSKIMNNQHLLFSAMDRIEVIINQEIIK
ncbi:MAG: TetR/AcrR family transcriptional regulator [Bacteroidota bacterium]